MNGPEPVFHEHNRDYFLRAVLCFCIGILLSAVMIGALPLDGEERIYENTVRLHVLANSDSEEDQALKYRVRDAVLLLLAEQDGELPDADAAVCLYAERLPEIEETARRVLADSGYRYPVRVTLTDEPYPERRYGQYTFPAGTYHSLRVMLGEAEGRNWWCVLFPPLCLSFASEETVPEQTPADGKLSLSPDGDEVLLSAGFTPYEVGILSGTGKNTGTKLRVKFHIVEWLRAWLNDRK